MPVVAASIRTLMLTVDRSQELCRLRQEMFGSMHRLPDQEYDSIYATTGLDADGRMQRYENYNALMELYIRAYAKFAKCVPGFSYLDIQDQVTLIKYSRNEFLLFMGFNEVAQGVIYCADKRMRCKVCVDIAGNIDFENMMDRFVLYCESYQNLKLTLEERILMGSIVLMAPDREHGVSSEKAKLIYELLNNCLIHLFRKRFSKPLQMYAKVVSLLVGIRTFNFESSKFIRSLRFDKYSSALNNPLLREMLGGIYFDDFEAPDTEVHNYDMCAINNL
ncbi:retinoic acid receptor beta-like [Elysia marginata]|uniref:Retinoic acid receptor beta-like n=1 Tax=Elysia marginata TaxID=1093978 RepID=A0AAV4JY58_9GAST|nr:retinoic acid receptor beta-like [Elysia marginata]